MTEALAEIEDDRGAGALSPGQVPRSWLANRRIGEATVEGTFANVGHSTSLSWLGQEMSGRLVHYGIHELDGASIRLTVPRRFTQEISRKVFELTHDGERAYAGIAYLSRLGDDLQNWAVFEPARLNARLPDNLTETDSDFTAALTRLGLTLVDG